MSINKVILIGNVGKDPEILQVKENQVAKFTLATSESYKNKAGEKLTNTEWHNIVIWGGLAKVVDNYVKKGSKLYLEGKISNRTYEKDGIKKYFTEIICTNMQMLDTKSSSEGSADNKKTDDDGMPF